jgi:hypothetical protein
MAHRHPIIATSAENGAHVNRKDDPVALFKRHDCGARLHARPLFRQHELAAGEVGIGLGQQDGDL